MKKLILLFSLFPFLTAEAQTLLFDQTDSITSAGILCREHTVATSAQFNTEGADDFTVPTGQTWYIDSVVVDGFYNATVTTATPVEVTIYSDNGGEPDTVVALREIADGDNNEDGNLEPDFSDDPIILGPGAYWLSVKVVSSTFPWYWQRINELHTADPFHWFNVGGGYAVCTDWEPLYTCISSLSDSSANFQIYGCYGPKPDLQIPADTTICTVDTPYVLMPNIQSGIIYYWGTGDTANSISISQSGEYVAYGYDQTTQCLGREVADITISQNPELTQLENDTACEGFSASLTGSANFCSLCEYIWDGDTTITPFFNTQDEGWHTLLVVDVNSGCTSEFDSAWIEIESTSPPDLSPDTAFFICEGDTETLAVLDIYDTYDWTTGSDSMAIVIIDSGTYSVTVTTPSGCESENSAYVDMKPAPTTTISTSITTTWKTKLKAGVGFQSYMWSNGDDEREITVNKDGEYTVTITDEFGCEGVVSIFVTVIPSGIDEANADAVKVFPNPTDALLNVQWSGAFTPKQMELVDATGRIVMTRTATSTNEQLDLSNIPSGYYLLNIRGDNGVESVQVLRH